MSSIVITPPSPSNGPLGYDEGASVGAALDDIPFIEEDIPEREPSPSPETLSLVSGSGRGDRMIHKSDNDLPRQMTSGQHKRYSRTLSDGEQGRVRRESHGKLTNRPSLEAEIIALRRKKMDRGIVMNDAKRVLDQFLMRHMKDLGASPLEGKYQGITEMETIEEQDSTLIAADGDGSINIPVRYIASSSNNGDDGSRVIGAPSVESYQDDGWSSHSPTSRTPSLGSHSSSFKHRVNIVHARPGETLEDVLQAGQRQKKRTRRTLQRSRSSSTDSSSSVSDSLSSGARKKKTFFRKARERLAQSFRKLRDKSPEDQESDTERAAPLRTKPKRRASWRLSFRKNSVNKRKEKYGEVLEEIRTHSKSHIHQEVHRNGSGNGTLLRTEEGSQVIDEHHNQYSPSMHRETKFKVKQSYPASDKDTYSPKRTPKEDRGFLGSFLRPFRKSSSKSKLKQGKHKSRSADAIQHYGIDRNVDTTLIDTHSHYSTINGSVSQTTEFHEVVGGRIQNGHLQPPYGAAAPLHKATSAALPFSSPHPDQESLRGGLKLEGLQVCRPKLPKGVDNFDMEYECDATEQLVRTNSGKIQVVTSHEDHQMVSTEDGLDEVDNGAPCLETLPPPESLTDLPFEQKTDKEKDDIYDKIAEQLALIADSYSLGNSDSFSSALGPSTGTPASPEGAARLPTPTVDTPLEEKLGLLLGKKGDAVAQGGAVANISPIVSDLIRNASYDKFKAVVNDNIGNEPSWQQLALVFQLTKSAVQLAGKGTAVAAQVKEVTLQYFEDKFAGWIMGQGGWESAMEDNTTDGPDSELD